MFAVNEETGRFTTYVLEDHGAGSRARVVPARGGLLTAFSIGERELFYLDPATLDDETKNVRGGNPVLFPTPGKLAGDAWTREGRSGALKQHGFARNLPWSVDGTDAEKDAALRISLLSSEATRAAFPWDFRVALRYALRGPLLRIDITVANTGAPALPFGFGFHPYFAVGDKAQARIPTRATRAFDNVTKREIACPSPLDLTLPEVDLHLIDHRAASAELELSGARVTLRGSPEFTRWVIWTLAGKPFVCLEPWTCPGNALNTGEGLLFVEAGSSRSLWLEIAG